MDRKTNTAERAAITLESLIENASQILDLAIAEKQFSAAVAALQEVGTLSGLRIERRRLVDPTSLSCSDTNKTAALGQSPCSPNADGAVMC